MSVLILFTALILLGAGCQTPSGSGYPQADLSDSGGFFDRREVIEEISEQKSKKSVVSSRAQTTEASAGRVRVSETQTAPQESPVFWESVPAIVASRQYFRSSISQEVIGQAKIRFINTTTRQPVPGHAADCTSCIDVYFTRDASGRLETVYPQSNANGEMILNLTDEEGSIAYARVDWHRYETVHIRPGDDVTIEMTPNIVGQGQKLSYAAATYMPDPQGRTRLDVTVVNRTGSPHSGNLLATGPILDQKRTTVSGTLDAEGKLALELPINGSYRIQLIPDINNFYQVEVMAGHVAKVTIREAEAPQPTVIGPDHLERGFILVCVLDTKTNASVYAVVGVPNSNIQFTRTVDFKGKTCTEVPQSYKEIYVPATPIQKGHQTVSTASVDSEGVLYLRVDAM